MFNRIRTFVLDTIGARQCPPPTTREAVDCWLAKMGRRAAVDGREPLTSFDVEQLIKINGGKAEYLCLNGRDLRNILMFKADLRKIDFYGADLRGANLEGSCLQGATLIGADLRDAILSSADMRGADLSNAKLQGGDLRGANLQDAVLSGIRFDEYTVLNDQVNWGPKFVSRLESTGAFREAQSSYQQLQIWHQNHGYYHIAGKFHFRELTCRRKQHLKNLIRRPWEG